MLKFLNGIRNIFVNTIDVRVTLKEKKKSSLCFSCCSMSEANYFVNMLYIFVSVFMCVSMYMPHMLYIVFLFTVSQFFMNALDTN